MLEIGGAMMMRRLTLTLSFLAIVGCSVIPVYINDSYELAVSNEVRDRILEDWFSCDECVNGQLRRVQELGNTALEPLVLAMSGTIPDLSDITDGYDQKCNRINDLIEARGLAVAEKCDQYVERYQHNLERRYHVRAIEALLAIRTQETCDAIGVERCLNIKPFPPFDIDQTGGRSTRVMGIKR